MLGVCTKSGTYLFEEDGMNPISTIKETDSTVFRVISNSIGVSASSQKGIVTFYKLSDQFKSSVASFYRVSVPEKITSMAVSHCGNFLFTGGVSGTVSLYALTGSLIRQFSAHYSAVTFMEIADGAEPDSPKLITASDDGAIKVFYVAELMHSINPIPITTFKGHVGEIKAFHLMFGHETVISADKETVKKWKISNGLEIASSSIPDCSVIGSTNIGEIWIGTKQGNLHILDKEKESSNELVHNGPINGIVFNRDCSVAITASPTDIKFWDVTSQQCMRTVTSAVVEKSSIIGLKWINKISTNTKSVKILASTLKPFQRVLTPANKIPSVLLHARETELTDLYLNEVFGVPEYLVNTPHLNKTLFDGFHCEELQKGIENVKKEKNTSGK
jgi:WD40 repeat protein